ncbi:hypothetical protein H4J02_04190 [Protaetiibacter sp. SSC-01]|uniref:hypothetical protein n=1 Tax=Protaetiibacter sp. SSC-01 TaxID=2759943 RepID=UPI0016570903|nr:hypothetical protein [Protaetiibacter sp. SSC-01]QNO38233.1 hypothetical protein H4J02_04190 [Protaetiibacter sp. SSC-01]
MIARALTIAAACSYVASCTLGLGVATGRLRTGRARWVHHALYISTAGTTTAATVALVAERGARGTVLAPALVPLAAIPYAGTRGWRHPALAASVGPFIAAALALVARPAPRKTRGGRRARPRRGA